MTVAATALVLKPIVNPSRRQRASAKRSVLKALTYGLGVGCLDFLVLYLLTGKTAVALGFIVVSNIYTTICYFIYERVWAHINWGKIDVKPAKTRERRRRVHSAVVGTRRFLRAATRRSDSGRSRTP